MLALAALLVSLPNALAFGSDSSAAAAVAGRYAVTEREHIYYDGDVKLYGYLMTPDTEIGSLPGLLVLPYFLGAPALNDREVGRRYAEKGMVVFVADYYGKQYDAASAEHIQEALTETYPALVGDWERAQRIASLGLEQLTSQPKVDSSRVGVLGFCMGGTMASFLVRSGADLSVAINYHGDNQPVADEVAADHNTKYYAAFFGRNDPLIAPEQIETGSQWLDEATSGNDHDYEVNVYGNTVHAFTVPIPTTILDFMDAAGFGGALKYEPARAEAAFARTDALFKQHDLLVN